jgi:hypothetical protein
LIELTQSLKRKLQRRRFIVAPGVFDMISLRIAASWDSISST